MKQTWARAISMFRKRKLDRELDEELRSHIELATEDYIRRGMPPADARSLARVKLGSIEASKDAHRDSRGIAWLETLFYDLRFAMRALIRERAFAATAILMLALALSLNVTSAYRMAKCRPIGIGAPGFTASENRGPPKSRLRLLHIGKHSSPRLGTTIPVQIFRTAHPSRPPLRLSISARRALSIPALYPQASLRVTIGAVSARSVWDKVSRRVIGFPLHRG
jgi:hypothetical protein